VFAVALILVVAAVIGMSVKDNPPKTTQGYVVGGPTDNAVTVAGTIAKSEVSGNGKTKTVTFKGGTKVHIDKSHSTVFEKEYKKGDKASFKRVKPKKGKPAEYDTTGKTTVIITTS